MDDYARALYGSRANTSATSMVASTKAIDDLIQSVQGGGAITLDNLLRAHATLMADDPYKRACAGKLHDIQNWIGGSDQSPRGALHVPPPPDTVPCCMDDLIDFMNRTDVPILLQAAAQVQ